MKTTTGWHHILVALAAVIAAAGILLRAAGLGTMHSPPLLNPTALLIVIGGTIALARLALGSAVFMQLPRLLTMRQEARPSTKMLVELFVSLSEKSRKEGLLALEEDIEFMKDKREYVVLHNSLQLVVDGVDPDIVRWITSQNIAVAAARHRAGQATVLQLSLLTIACGMLCSLFFVATGGGTEAFAGMFWGLLIPCLLWVPAMFRLRQFDRNEQCIDEMTATGIISIMCGDNPRIVQDRLVIYLPLGERKWPQPVEPVDEFPKVVSLLKQYS